MAKETEKIDLTKNLEELSEISSWFEERDEIDVEEGLVKVKKAAVLIKESKGRLKEIENEFQEIKKDLDNEGGDSVDESSSDGIDF